MANERVVYHDGNLLVSVGTRCTKEEGKTRQSDEAAADINKIMARFDFGALNAEFQARLDRGEAPWFGVDVSETPDYQSALALVERMDEYFMRLPADVRAAFDNSPAVMVDAYNAGTHDAEFEKIGLLPVAKSVPAEEAAKPPVAQQGT